jgi:hypothetical protein
MIKHLFSLLMVLTLFLFASNAQDGNEVLVDLEYQRKDLPKGQGSISKNSLVHLPFFDDFSRSVQYAEPSLWDARHVFVNTKYAINPPTIGVVTLDALDNTGNLHYQASAFQFSSDTLASKRINLNFPGDTTIYISFYFQPQGLGNQPDSKDSLLLEFYNYSSDNWEGVWAGWVDFSNGVLFQKNKLVNKQISIESDALNSTFFRVHFPIIQDRFLNENFRFRFRNIASLSSNTDVPGLRGNSDHWHIDMIYLNRNRSYRDTLINDIAFSRPLGSILKNYESVPWSHFTQTARSSELSNPLSFNISYRNLGVETWNITRLFRLLDHSTNETYSFSGGAENIFALQDIDFSRFYLYDFQSAWSDSAKFTFTSFLVTDINPETQHLRWNDTLSYTQSFSNYYAYDDGTAESGYGLYGEGTQNGRVALKYTTYSADWLVGVYMYFNRTFSDANQKYFRLAVWDDDNGKPGNIIYDQVGVRPIFTDSLNRFTLFKLDEDLWLEPGTFYIGWIQTTTDMLNVGFDRNKNNRTKLFYNISGNWQNSQFEGSLMIRPVFGELTENPTVDKLFREESEFIVYPNPAKYAINLKLPSSSGNFELRIFNISGQQVLSQRVSDSAIDISPLPNGTYILRVFDSGRILGTQKFIVLR